MMKYGSTADTNSQSKAHKAVRRAPSKINTLINNGTKFKLCFKTGKGNDIAYNMSSNKSRSIGNLEGPRQILESATRGWPDGGVISLLYKINLVMKLNKYSEAYTIVICEYYCS